MGPLASQLSLDASPGALDEHTNDPTLRPNAITHQNRNEDNHNDGASVNYDSDDSSYGPKNAPNPHLRILSILLQLPPEDLIALGDRLHDVSFLRRVTSSD